MATYTGIKAILEQFKTRMIKTKVNNAAQADNATNATHATKADSATTATSATNATNATNADKLDGYHASNSSYPCLVPVTACSLGSTSGYIKLGNGLIVQWGKVTNTGSSHYRTYTFPIAYTQTPIVFSEFIVDKTPSENGFHISSVSTTGFVTIYPEPINWIAIGY